MLEWRRRECSRLERGRDKGGWRGGEESLVRRGQEREVLERLQDSGGADVEDAGGLLQKVLCISVDLSAVLLLVSQPLGDGQTAQGVAAAEERGQREERREREGWKERVRGPVVEVSPLAWLVPEASVESLATVEDVLLQSQGVHGGSALTT
jgi:hypothetical protein